MPYNVSKLRKVFKNKKRVLILTHSNPDPDAIASAWGMQYLFKEKLKIRSKIVYDGFIGRAENKTMVRLLKIKLYSLSSMKLSSKDSIILVDTQPGMGNNSLPSVITPSLVIDHHPLKKKQKSTLIDVRKDVGSTATIVTEYLVENKLEIPRNLATALFYGIGSETKFLSVETDNLDKRYYKLLFPQISQFLLSKIQYPQHSSEFFLHLRKALDNAFVCKNAILVDMGKIDNADLISEFCSFFLLYDKVTWALSFAEMDGKLLFSIRTQNRRVNSGKIAKKIAADNGSGGGHEMSAGGWIKLKDKDRISGVAHRLIEDFLLRLGHKDITLTPLIPRDRQGGLRNV